MCDNQIVLRHDYASFSVLGLVIILVVGALIILTNYFCWPRLRRGTAGNEYRDDQWKLNELLELQPKSTKDSNKDDLEKSPKTSSSSISRDTLVNIVKYPKSLIWKIRTTDSATDKQSDRLSKRAASISTLETQIQHNDFPGEELTVLLTPISGSEQSR